MTLPGNINGTHFEQERDSKIPLLLLYYPEPLPDNILYVSAICRDYRGREVAGTFTYSPPPGTVLPVGLQTVSVSFRPTLAHKYDCAVRTRIVLVKPQIPRIFWRCPRDLLSQRDEGKDESTTLEIEVPYGSALPPFLFDSIKVYALTGSGQVQEVRGGTRLFSHPRDSSPLEVGVVTFTAEFEPGSENPTLSRAYGTVLVRVVGALVPLRWRAPAALRVAYPELLPSSLFNASSADPAVEGTMTYHPAPGLLLGAGEHQLRAVFEPKDARRYRRSETAIVVHIEKGEVTLNWSPLAPIRQGQAFAGQGLALRSHCTNSRGLVGSYRFSSKELPQSHSSGPAKGSLQTIDDLLTQGHRLVKGLHDVTVTFEPRDRCVLSLRDDPPCPFPCPFPHLLARIGSRPLARSRCECFRRDEWSSCGPICRACLIPRRWTSPPAAAERWG